MLWSEKCVFDDSKRDENPSNLPPPPQSFRLVPIYGYNDIVYEPRKFYSCKLNIIKEFPYASLRVNVDSLMKCSAHNLSVFSALIRWFYLTLSQRQHLLSAIIFGKHWTTTTSAIPTITISETITPEHRNKRGGYLKFVHQWQRILSMFRKRERAKKAVNDDFQALKWNFHHSFHYLFSY